EAVKTLLRAGDMLADHVAAARGAGALPDDAQIIGALALLAGEDPQAASGDFAPADFEGLDFAPLRIVVEDAPRDWRIVFRPHAALYASANEPALLLRALAGLG